MGAYLRNSVQDQTLCFVKGLLHRWWVHSGIIGASKLLNNCLLHTLPKRAVEVCNFTFRVFVSLMWKRRHFFKRINTMQHQSRHPESCCSATWSRQRCRNTCPWHLAELWSGLCGNPQNQTWWFSAPSCSARHCVARGCLCEARSWWVWRNEQHHDSCHQQNHDTQ